MANCFLGGLLQLSLVFPAPLPEAVTLKETSLSSSSVWSLALKKSWESSLDMSPDAAFIDLGFFCGDDWGRLTEASRLHGNRPCGTGKTANCFPPAERSSSLEESGFDLDAHDNPGLFDLRAVCFIHAILWSPKI